MYAIRSYYGQQRRVMAIHLRIVEHVPGASLFCRIHCNVGSLNQSLRVDTVIRIKRDTDSGVDVQLMGFDDKGSYNFV